MFTYERNELSIPLVGFLLVGFAAIFSGIFLLNAADVFSTDTAAVQICSFALAIMLSAVSAYAFSKLMLLEGVLFGIFALAMFCSTAGFDELGFFGLVIAIMAVMLAFMALRAGDVLIMMVSLMTVVGLIGISVLDSDGGMVIGAVGFLGAGAFSLYYAITDWMLIQDIEFEMEDEMYGDECGCEDEEICDCGCEEHIHDEKCDCGCNDHKE